MSSSNELDMVNRKHRCCCGCMHVQTGVQIISGLSILGCVASLINLFAEPSAASGLGLVLNVCVTVCLFLALCKENERFLIPYMAQAVLAIFLFVCADFYLIANEVNYQQIAITTIVFGLATFITLWLGSVVYTYYIYLIYKKSAPVQDAERKLNESINSI